MTNKRKGNKPKINRPRPSNFITHTMLSGPYQVTTYMNNKGGFTVIAFKEDDVLDKKRVDKVSDINKEFFNFCEKYIPTAEYQKGIEEDKKQSGPDSEGCSSGHCPVR